MSSIEKVWSAFKVNPASEALYTDDVFVVYVPTSAGGRGLGDVVRFYSQQDFVPSVNVVKETIHKKILTEDAVVEEVEWSVTFTSGECCWLLPNLDKSHLVRVYTDGLDLRGFFRQNINSYWNHPTGRRHRDFPGCKSIFLGARNASHHRLLHPDYLFILILLFFRRSSRLASPLVRSSPFVSTGTKPAF